MAKYIDAEHLKELLNNKYKEFTEKSKNNCFMQYQFMADGLTIAGQMVDSLQQEQPSLPDNLDEAAEKQGEMVDNYGDPYGAVVDAFKAGAEWMAGHGEVQEHFVIGHTEASHGHPVIVHYPESFEIGDEVIVQIRKKEK